MYILWFLYVLRGLCLLSYQTCPAVSVYLTDPEEKRSFFVLRRIVRLVLQDFAHFKLLYRHKWNKKCFKLLICFGILVQLELRFYCPV